MNVLRSIYDVLKKNDIDVYFPGQHNGECVKEYVVVKSAGVNDEIIVSSERPLYDIMLYVPENKYSSLESSLQKVKQNLKELYPLISYTGVQTESYYDESVKGHMISVQYQGIRKLENR